jgi:hypothetical protein
VIELGKALVTLTKFNPILDTYRPTVEPKQNLCCHWEQRYQLSSVHPLDPAIHLKRVCKAMERASKWNTSLDFIWKQELERLELKAPVSVERIQDYLKTDEGWKEEDFGDIQKLTVEVGKQLFRVRANVAKGNCVAMVTDTEIDDKLYPQMCYDPFTGNVGIAMASASETKSTVIEVYNSKLQLLVSIDAPYFADLFESSFALHRDQLAYCFDRPNSDDSIYGNLFGNWEISL